MRLLEPLPHLYHTLSCNTTLSTEGLLPRTQIPIVGFLHMHMCSHIPFSELPLGDTDPRLQFPFPNAWESISPRSVLPSVSSHTKGTVTMKIRTHHICISNNHIPGIIYVCHICLLELLSQQPSPHRHRHETPSSSASIAIRPHSPQHPDDLPGQISSASATNNVRPQNMTPNVSAVSHLQRNGCLLPHLNVSGTTAVCSFNTS